MILSFILKHRRKENATALKQWWRLCTRQRSRPYSWWNRF